MQEHELQDCLRQGPQYVSTCEFFCASTMRDTNFLQHIVPTGQLWTCCNTAATV